MERENILQMLNDEVEVSMPANILKISYDDEFHRGEFIMADEAYGKQVAFIPVKELGRYQRFNSNLNRNDVLSNFFNPYEARKAINLFTGKPLQRDLPGLKFKLYLFGYLVKGEELKRAVLILSGATLKSFIDYKPNLPKAFRGRTLFHLKTEKQKTGSVVYFNIKFYHTDLPDSLLNAVLNDVVAYTQDIQSYVEYVNNTSIPPIPMQQENTDILDLV